MMNSHNKISVSTVAMLSALSLSACNTDFLNQASDSATEINKTSTGVVSALNKLKVNGITYDTALASIKVDKVAADISALKLGMVVSITGSERSDGTGQAILIEAEDITEGVVNTNNLSIDNSLLVMGQTVHVDNKTIFESLQPTISQLADIREGNVLEVSGYTDGNGEIWATRMEIKVDTFETGREIEVKGRISNLTQTTFTLGNLTVNYSGASLSNGWYVEASSTQGLDSSGVLIADSIEIKSKGEPGVKHTNNDEEVELRGRITAMPGNTSIEVNGTSVLLNGINTGTFTVGDIIEVEGYVDAQGKFYAKHLKSEAEADAGTYNDRDGSENEKNEDSESESEHNGERDND